MLFLDSNIMFDYKTSRGLVLVTYRCEVIFKIMTWTNGANSIDLARKLEQHCYVPSLSEVYNLALESGFGTKKSLVVMGKKNTKHSRKGDLPKKYKETFNKDEFPYGNRGTDYINRANICMF